MALLLTSLKKVKVNSLPRIFRKDKNHSTPILTEEKELPFAELQLLRGDIHRGKLPLGWNMVKALHAPWVTPLGKGMEKKKRIFKQDRY